MIGNQNDSNEEDSIFSNPETLEQLRQQLLDLDQQDRQSLQAIERDFQACYQKQEQVFSVDNFENTSARGVKRDFIQEILFHVREKSACFTTLTQLAVRMIDWIGEQQQQHIFSLQRVQGQLDQLREINQSLMSRNLHIENDVEYFREHLRAAESQLEGIINQQESLQEQEKQIIEKDRLIDQLQIQLQKIRGQLQFYKFSNRSRKSNLLLHQNGLKNAPSNQTLISSSGLAPCISTQNINTYSCIYVQRLEIENEKMKRQIFELKNQQERLTNKIFYDIKEQKYEQTERRPFEISPSANQLISKEMQNKTTQMPVLQKGMLYNFKQHLDTPRSNNEQAFQISQPQEIMKIQSLNNDWSSKTFEVRALSRPTNLFYLNNQEQSLSEKMNSQAYLHPIIQQTRQTEGSIKEAEYFLPRKEVIHVGVNTESQLEQTLDQNPQQKIDDSGLLSRLAETKNIFNKCVNYLVKKRIRRNVHRANQSLLLIFC